MITWFVCGIMIPGCFGILTLYRLLTPSQLTREYLLSRPEVRGVVLLSIFSLLTSIYVALWLWIIPQFSLAMFGGVFLTVQAFCLGYLIFLSVFRLDPTFLARMNMAAVKNQAREIVYDYMLPPHPNTDSSKSCHLNDTPSPAKMQPDAQLAYESLLNAYRTKRCVSIMAVIGIYISLLAFNTFFFASILREVEGPGIAEICQPK